MERDGTGKIPSVFIPKWKEEGRRERGKWETVTGQVLFMSPLVYI
jgi:hypothetical protein